jgi:hypothetical protein
LLITVLTACAQQPTASLRIVYLTNRADLPWNMLSPASLHAALGARVASNWGDVLAVHAADPLDGLIIDANAAGQVDPEELGRLYRQCVVLAFFNLYSPAVAELVQDPSIRGGGWMDGSEPYPGDFYIIVHRQASDSLNGCNGGSPVSSRSQYSLGSIADFRIFLSVLRLGLATQPSS